MTRYQGSQAWLEARRHSIGSSEVPVLVEGDAEQWTELFGRKLGRLPDPEENEAMRLGHIFEDPIARAYTARTGIAVQRVDRLLRHPDLPYVTASLDRRHRRGKVIVEVKARRSAGDAWGPDGSDLIPDGVLYQVQEQMAVADYPQAVVVAHFGGGDLRQYAIGRDQSLIDQVLRLISAAWRYVERGQMPPWPGSAGRVTVLREDEIAADTALTDLVILHEERRAAAEAADEALEAVKAELRSRLADVGAAVGAMPDGRPYRVIHRPTKDRVIVGWEQIARAYRELIDRYEHGLTTPDPSIELDVIQEMFTTTKPGSRPLLVNVKESRSRVA